MKSQETQKDPTQKEFRPFSEEIVDLLRIAKEKQAKKTYKTYIINGDPVALARARFGTHGKVWDSQKQTKLVWGVTINNQHNGDPFFTGPLHLDVVFYMPISKTKKNLDGKYHVFTPDLDNMLKFICDIATGVLFKDDCIIASITTKKVYDKDPRTEFTIRRLS